MTAARIIWVIWCLIWVLAWLAFALMAFAASHACHLAPVMQGGFEYLRPKCGAPEAAWVAFVSLTLAGLSGAAIFLPVGKPRERA